MFYAFNGQLTRPVQEMKVIKAVELYSTFTAESVAVHQEAASALSAHPILTS